MLKGTDKQRRDKAIDAFAVEMKRTMDIKANEGYAGWDKPYTHNVDRRLAKKALDLLQGGTAMTPWTTIDIANFAMMLWNSKNNIVNRPPDRPLTDQKRRA